MDKSAVFAKIDGLSAKHILKQSPPSYVDGFVDALLNVYPAKSLEAILQEKYHVPDESSYTDKSFCQFACELTVANHLKLGGYANFHAEKKLNLPLETDVDAYCDIDGHHVSVEVKCPELTIDEYDSANPVFKINFVGRIPDYQREFDQLLATLGSKMRVELAKRLDNKLKDYLTSAHGKFRSPSLPSDANVLFVALDDYYSMVDWNTYLFANQGGFFGPNPYVEKAKFQQVDAVILSNLQSAHTIGRAYHDWTLKDIYMIPRITRNPRQGMDDLTIGAALKPFPHELKGFYAFQSTTSGEDILRTAAEITKITHYAVEGLSDADRKRYFPVPTNRMKSTGEATAQMREERAKVSRANG